MSPAQPLLIAYARISDLSGKRRTLAAALGVEAQHAACEAMARDAGAVVIKQYTDNDRSAGRDEKRAGFEAMLADLHRGRIGDGEPVEGVITVDVDRIYKTPAQWERFVTAFRAAPGRAFLDWQGHRDLYASDAEETGWHDVSGIMGENSRRGDRTRRWHAAQARRGIAHTGGRVFGYRPVRGAPGVIEVVPAEAAVIREAVAACVEGLPLGSITQIFARSGIPTENGGPWRAQTVKQIISSPRLAGLRMLNGEVVTDDAGEPVPGCWEPIISPSEWETVRKRYSPRHRAPGGRSLDGKGRTPRKYLLSGFLLCGREVDGQLCRCVMSGCAPKAGRSTYRYACRPKSDGGCGGSAVRGECMDQEVADLVLGMLTDARPGTLQQDAWTRARELAAIQAKQEELHARRQRGDIDQTLFLRRSAVLEEILQDLLAEKEDWEAVEACFNDEASERLRRWRMRPETGGYSLRQRRALVAEALTSVLVFPAGRGRRRQRGEGYLPVLNPSLAISPGG
ncbi:recombinase family protein [Actinomadura bangladeshensis]|uniref:Recombinase family protein n=1 Tax=Actinomadura bangladeshensis TaxID=453573 RepID=A0A4R4PAG4_9ACTN|nr:recombinase family protein [Actinomadura bangladeshensis]TDC17947.1 recombinase family protein [Actinomadura bangladeshensis]